jgi:hypothetical protein
MTALGLGRVKAPTPFWTVEFSPHVRGGKNLLSSQRIRKGQRKQFLEDSAGGRFHTA